jgi:Ca2+-binding EF-hand superfamily protein
VDGDGSESQKLDDEGEGTIGRDKIRTVVCGSKDDADECEIWVDQAIQIADTDGDGFINKEEFYQVCLLPSSLGEGGRERAD